MILFSITFVKVTVGKGLSHFALVLDRLSGRPRRKGPMEKVGRRTWETYPSGAPLHSTKRLRAIESHKAKCYWAEPWYQPVQGCMWPLFSQLMVLGRHWNRDTYPVTSERGPQTDSLHDPLYWAERKSQHRSLCPGHKLTSSSSSLLLLGWAKSSFSVFSIQWL